VVGSALGGPAFARLSKHIGKHRAAMVGTCGYSIGLWAFLLVSHGAMVPAGAVMVWLGFAQSGFTMMVQAMSADVGDEVRLAGGHERIGLIYALITLATKLSGALAIGLTFPLLAHIGFKAAEGAVNTPAAIRGLELAYLVGPSAFVMAGGACFIGWRLDARRHAEIRQGLDERDARLAGEAALHPEFAHVAPLPK
jgi:Na+/melibiose symporter-like transporter